MSEYIVTARKWRPMKFEDVVGQTHVTTTLRNAIASQRLAHAYLFSGPRGVGKTTTARILSKAVNCASPVEYDPDNTCPMCVEITEGRSFDVREIDGASNRGVDEIRNLRESVRYAPSQGKFKVYIIDEVHMLTKEAFNALLKTLEEPPPHILFVFATTEIQKVPATILSRCQRFEFHRISIEAIMANLRAIAAEEQLSFDDEALRLIAKRGDGSLRDSQSMFDQAVSLCGRTVSLDHLLRALNIVDVEVFFQVTEYVRTKNARAGLELVEHVVNNGYDLKEFLTGFVEHLRNILVVKTTGSAGILAVSEAHGKRLVEESSAFTSGDILRMLRHVQTTEAALRWSSQPRYRVEADLVQLITMPSAAEIGELLEQIEELKKKLDVPSGLSVEERPRQAPAKTILPRTTGSLPRQRASLAGAPAVSSPPTASPLTEGEVSGRWPEFVNEVRRQRISLGSVLESTTLLGTRGNAIRLSCANDFQASAIQRNKDLLSSVLQKIFHSPGRFEVEISSSPGESQEKHHPPTASLEPKAAEHPVVQAIIRELGAEPLS